MKSGEKFPNWFEDGGARKQFEIHLKEFIGKPMSVLQIGAFTGDASLWLLQNVLIHSEASLYDIDTWEGSSLDTGQPQLDWREVEAEYDSKVLEFGGKVSKFKMLSSDFFDENARTFDFIYIDGDHKASSVLADGLSAYHVIKPSGIIAFDDYKWTSGLGVAFDPKIAIDSIRHVCADKLLLMELGEQAWFKSCPHLL